MALTVKEMQHESFETATEKGWHDEDHLPPSIAIQQLAGLGIRLMELCNEAELVRKGQNPSLAKSAGCPVLDDKQVRAMAWLMLLGTEVAEAMEDVIAGRWKTTINSETGKPEGLGSELADIQIRVGDDAGAWGIDLEAEVLAKMTYNKTRAHRGKLA